jgi:hypothetical protein
MHDNQV